jgi:4-aminobutyrate aminotransferase
MSSNVAEFRSNLPDLQTALPGPRAKAIIDRDTSILSPSYTRSYPLVVERGHGALIEDVDGNRFLDFNAGIGVIATGHCHPDVVAAIQEQASRLIHMSGTDFYYENMVELGEKLAALAPGQVDRLVYFGNSGAEAVEAAMKMARYQTGRQNYIAFLGAFHGRTMGALSLTASKSVQKKGFRPLVPGVHHIPFANCYRCAYGKQPETCHVECARVIEDRLIKTILPAEEIAGIFVEPVQGEGGYVVPPRKFHEELQRISQKYGILLILDEVQAGMGRTGKMWASEHFGIVPDIMTSAKGIASGMPLSATIARKELMQWKPGSHASTFGGNPVCVAAALVTVELLERELIANAAAVGAHIMDRLRDWPRRYPNVGDVRGLGLMIGIELVEDQSSREPAPELRNRLIQMAFERGVLLLGASTNVIRLSPPLVVTQDQADFALDTLEECLKRATSGA